MSINIASRLNPLKLNRWFVELTSEALLLLVIGLLAYPIAKEINNQWAADAIKLTPYASQFHTEQAVMDEFECFNKAVYRESSPFDELGQSTVADNILNRVMTGKDGGTTICEVTKKHGFNKKGHLVYQYTSMGTPREKEWTPTKDSMAFTRHLLSAKFTMFLVGNDDPSRIESTDYYAYYVDSSWGKPDVEKCIKHFIGLYSEHLHFVRIPLKDRPACFKTRQNEKDLAAMKKAVKKARAIAAAKRKADDLGKIIIANMD